MTEREPSRCSGCGNPALDAHRMYMHIPDFGHNVFCGPSCYMIWWVRLEARRKERAEHPKIMERRIASLVEALCTSEPPAEEHKKWLAHLREELLDATIYITELLRQKKE